MKFVFCLDSGTFSTDLSPARAIRRLHVLLEPASIPCSNVKNHQCQDAQSIQRTQRQPLLKHKDNSCVCHGNHDTVLQVLGLYVIWTSGFAQYFGATSPHLMWSSSRLLSCLWPDIRGHLCTGQVLRLWSAPTPNSA